MRPDGTIRPFPNLEQIARLCSARPSWSTNHLAAVFELELVERDRALLSILLDADRPAWVRTTTSTAEPRSQHGGRRRSILSWADELAVVDELEVRTANGDTIRPIDVAAMMSRRIGRPVTRLSAYRLLHRHGWVLTCRSSGRRAAA
jgi:hypothetical protein